LNTTRNHIKEALGRNLSLSSKLFLKGLFAGFKRLAVGTVTTAPPPEIGDRPRIIVFDERVPSPDRDAGSGRMFMILKTLAEWSHVVFVPFNRPQGIEYERALWKEGIETADAVDYRRLLKHKNVKAAIVSRPSIGKALVRRIRRVNPEVKIVFDMVDTHFIRLEREYQLTGSAITFKQAKRYRKLEQRIGEASDLIWCASVEDKQVMAREVLSTRIEVVPTIHPLHDSGKTFEGRRDLLFVGNFAHRPNNDGIIFFLKEIYPLIRKAISDVNLDIIGDNVSAEISAYHSEQVRVRGYVPDIGPYLRACRVFIAPLRFGAGIKGKVGEAMSFGIPVVTTSIGAEGFGLTDELNAMVADTPEAFAAAVTRLYSDKALWDLLAENSRFHVEKHFTPEVIAHTINNSIREVSGLKPIINAD